MSTPRFMLLWALTAAPIHFVWGIAYAWLLLKAADSDDAGLLHLRYAMAGAVALALGAIQSRLLTRHRARIRFWPLAGLLGTLAAMLVAVPLSTWTFRGGGWPDIRIIQWIHPIVIVVTMGLCLAAALGLAIWGRRWASAWPLWLAGVVILQLCSLGLVRVLMASEHSETVNACILALKGAIEAAGLAWMLDRLVFKPATSFAGVPIERV